MPVYQLHPEFIAFPNAEEAEEDGLLAIGGDLSEQRLIEAYASGIFPWYSQEPILWWSPDPRFVMKPQDFRLSKSLKRTYKTGRFEVKLDTNFREVIKNCSKIKRTHEDGTWINKDIVEAYTKLWDLGLAHSAETYYEGELVGGLYGVSLGRCFFGESMFHKMSDASKLAFWKLCEFLEAHDFDIIDSQIHTAHLESLGAYFIPRKEYLKIVENSIQKPTMQGKWRF